MHTMIENLGSLLSFRDTRSQVLQESLHQLGVEKLSKDDVQKIQWEVLELKIGTWIHFMRIAVGLNNMLLILLSSIKLATFTFPS